MDLTDSIAPKSDQLDAVDLLAGPRTFTIERVTKGNPEQPFNFHLAEFPRVWRPGKSMRRVIVAAWGSKSDAYVGKRITLYCDPDVMFGGEKVGGSRISHMSGIDGPIDVPLIVKRGKSSVFRVQPLTEAARPPMASKAQLDQIGQELDRLGHNTAAARKDAVTEIMGGPIAASMLTAEEADVLIQTLAAKVGGNDQ